MTPFAELLRRYRKSRHLNQRELSELLGVKQSYLSILETGHKKTVPISLLEKIENVLELNKQEVEKFRRYQSLCSQTVVPPISASIQELEFVAALNNSLGCLSEEAILALHTMLNVASATIKKEDKMKT